VEYSIGSSSSEKRSQISYIACRCTESEHLWPGAHFLAHRSQNPLARLYCFRALTLSLVLFAQAASVVLLSSALAVKTELSILGGAGSG
jgi:hypothetical protein